MRTSLEYHRCPEKRFLSPNSTKFTGLVSYPQSGALWLRHLLEVATGIYTGSVYKDVEFYKSGTCLVFNESNCLLEFYKSGTSLVFNESNFFVT